MPAMNRSLGTGEEDVRLAEIEPVRPGDAVRVHGLDPLEPSLGGLPHRLVEPLQRPLVGDEPGVPEEPVSHDVVGVVLLVEHPARDLVGVGSRVGRQVDDHLHRFFDRRDVLVQHREPQVVTVDSARNLAVGARLGSGEYGGSGGT